MAHSGTALNFMELLPTFPTPGHRSEGIFIGDGYLTTLGAYFSLQSNIIDTDAEGAIQNVLTGLNLEKMYWLSFPRNKANCS